MAKTLSDSAVSGMRAQMDQATSNPNKIPGVVMVVVEKSGKQLFSHASGTRSIESKEPMTLDTVFWIASCTKMIGAIAAMKLVEQGKIGLDDAEAVEKLCPELKSKKILKSVDEYGKCEWAEKTKGITLRMLLTHTAGFGYTFFNHELRRFGEPIGYDELSGFHRDVMELPLLFEPGTQWEYGVNIDWAGELVARLSGIPLNDYMQKEIFEPLGLKNISMFPNEDMKAHLAYMHQKEGDKIFARDHLLKRPLIVEEKETKDVFNSAGAGCFAKPVEYCEILAMLLNDGVSPTTGNRVLKAETVDEMFKNQIPQFPDFGRQPIPAANPHFTNPIPVLYPQENDPQGWGLSAMITISPGVTGRGANTMWWAGLPNLFWWCDREKGVAGIIASQILPFADPDILGLWFGIEGAVYSALAS